MLKVPPSEASAFSGFQSAVGSPSQVVVLPAWDGDLGRRVDRQPGRELLFQCRREHEDLECRTRVAPGDPPWLT